MLLVRIRDSDQMTLLAVLVSKPGPMIVIGHLKLPPY